MYSERAKQFMSFAALRGYEDMIKRRAHTVERRRELSEDEAEILSRKMNRVISGRTVRVTYYNTDGYTELEGMVADLDRYSRILTVVKTKIPLDDIIDISGEGVDDIIDD